jgi:transposase/DNA-directed RNA polymerase subunit RPC12/RpoP
MEAAWLASRLEEGRSIESIAREAGRSASTVAYWVNKHGLASKHARKHAARGGIARAELEALVQAGLSIRRMAEQLGVSYTTVRHWLKRYELTTPRARRLAESAAARRGDLTVTTATCPRHGPTTFGRVAPARYRCLKCRSEAVVARRRRLKELLVAEAGGRCVLCGYDRSAAALQFHHMDPGEKAFSIAQRGVTRSLAAALEEAAKCVLLCATCHAEVEAGIATLPKTAADNRG